MEKVRMNLVGEDGNAFAIMGRFQREARRAGWTQEQINEVLDDCRSSDYNHLLQVMMEHTEELDEEDDDDYSYC